MSPLHVHAGGLVLEYSEEEHKRLLRVLAARDARLKAPCSPSMSNVPFVSRGIPSPTRIAHGDPFFWSKWIHEHLLDKQHHSARGPLDKDIEQKKAINSKFGDRVPRFNAREWLARKPRLHA